MRQGSGTTPDDDGPVTAVRVPLPTFRDRAERRYSGGMRVEYDRKTDQAYIYLGEIEAGGVAEAVPGWPDSIAFGINLDFDHEGRLVGIEVDGSASRGLPPDVLTAANRL